MATASRTCWASWPSHPAPRAGSGAPGGPIGASGPLGGFQGPLRGRGLSSQSPRSGGLGHLSSWPPQRESEREREKGGSNLNQIRIGSCSSCPYRRDVPSGVWAAHEYDKLIEYDRPTAEQPWAPFMCHATPDHYCHGWAACHSNRGAGYELLALRMAEAREVVSQPALPAPDPRLFSSGVEAAEHGKRDIKHPSPAARRAVARLVRKYERLRYG